MGLFGSVRRHSVFCIACYAQIRTVSSQADAGIQARRWQTVWSERLIFELRTYRATPGRLGDLRRRFQESTLSLFRVHDMTVVGMWDVLIGPNPSIVYLLAFRDLAHRQASWDAFSTDPEWVAARQRSEAAGPILESTDSIILRTVSFVADPIPGPDA